MTNIQILPEKPVLQLSPPLLAAAKLVPLRAAFDDDRYLFEMKYDGWRTMVRLTPGHCQMVSRRGNGFQCFEELRKSLASLDRSAVLDGEVVVLDEAGRPQLYDLQRRRREAVLCAFDCVWLDGHDLRELPLLERKREVQQLVQGHPRILFASHIERDGAALFRLVCESNLEGVVAKRKDGAYGEDWFKIRNPGYIPGPRKE